MQIAIRPAPRGLTSIASRGATGGRAILEEGRAGSETLATFKPDFCPSARSYGVTFSVAVAVKAVPG